MGFQKNNLRLKRFFFFFKANAHLFINLIDEVDERNQAEGSFLLISSMLERKKNSGGVKGFGTNASKNHFYSQLAVITSFTTHFNLNHVRRLAKQTVRRLILSCRKTKSDAQQLHARGNVKL